MDYLQNFLENTSDKLWGMPLILALIGTGVFLTIRLRFVQFRYMPKALRMIFMPPKDEKSPGEITHFQALMTALAATVGTGNIAGVATAIALGGPGAVFWMWMTGLAGMATKYSEAVLAIRFRKINKNGSVAGGPMYYIEHGLKNKKLAVAFAFFACTAAFGIGNMVQSNSIAHSIEVAFGAPVWITGIIVAVLSAMVILGGIKSIGRVTQFFVPLMIVVYMTAGIIAVLMNINLLPGAVRLIFAHAFSGQAALGGLVGAGIREAMRFGMARGIFSNESGLGSSPIAAAAARTDHPVTQALVSMTQTFIDTIVVCSMTAFIIIMSGAANQDITGAALTSESFNVLFGSGIGAIIIAVSLATFAYSTILGWSYYGEISAEYLFGARVIKPYRILFVAFVFIGAVLKLEIVWSFSDIMNGLMALPNLVALVLLSGELKRVHDDYFHVPDLEREFTVEPSTL